MMRAALYCRVSTEDQAREGTSLATQSERCRAHIESLGWELVEEYIDEGVSGTIALPDRPAGGRLMTACRAGAVDAVVVQMIDRVGRDAADGLTVAKELQNLGVGLVSVTEPFDSATPAGRLMFGQLMGMSEFFRAQFVERTTAGLIARAREGRWPGGPAPLGFRIEDKRLVLDEDEAAIIRKAASLIVDDGETTWIAAATLNALGMTPRNGTRWEHPNLRRTLLSPTLGGSWFYRPKNAEPIEMAVPRILDADRHAALLDALRATSTTAGERGRVYPLTGRLISLCGEPYHGIWRRDRGTRWYRCRNARPELRERKCSCRNINADLVETAVWREVTAVLSDPTRLYALAEEYLGLQEEHEGEFDGDVLTSVDRQLDRLDAARTRRVADALKAGVSATVLQAAVAELDAEEQTLRAHRARLVALKQRADDEGDRAMRLRELAEGAERRLGSMDLTEQRAVLELLEITVAVTGWSRCATCGGKGKLRGGTGGLMCPSCYAARDVPSFRIEGVVLDDLEVGHLNGSTSKRRVRRVPHDGLPFRVVVAA